MKPLKLLSILLVFGVCVNVVVDAKRSYSIGRSRKKSANINVRRKGAIPDAPRPVAPDTPSGVHTVGASSSGAMGPPPPYPGMGHHSVAPHGAPPVYSPSGYANPPSYQQAVGTHIGKIPPRGSSGLTYQDSTSFRGLGQGHNAFGAPSQTAGLYNAHGGGGFSGPGVYGSGYGYGGGSSNPFSFGNILAGLAVWNLARGFNSHGRHEQHVYMHDNRQRDAVSVAEAVDSSESSTIVPSEETLPFADDEKQTEIVDVLPTTEPSEMDPYFYATIHPSLLIYAQNTGSEYTRSNTPT